MADMPRLDDTPSARRKASLLEAFDSINAVEEQTGGELDFGVVIFGVETESGCATGWRTTGFKYPFMAAAFLRSMADDIEAAASS